MHEIYKFAIANGKINGDLLVEALSSTDLVLDATLSAILGLVDVDYEIAKLPKTILKNSSGVECTLISANYYKQTIVYSHPYVNNRYFTTEEDAKYYSENQKVPSNCRSYFMKDPDHPFEGSYISDSRSICSFNDWMKWSSEKK